MEKKKCFVIMPFSKTRDSHDENYWNVFFEIIKSIFEKNNYECKRSEVGPYSLIAKIIQDINDSDIVVAVLTDLNANVWYELGIRHTLKNGTLMLMQEGNAVPFDIKEYGVIFYKESISLEKELSPKIEDYLEKLEKQTCDSPVLNALGSKIDKNYESKLEQLLWTVIKEISKGGISTDKFRKEKRILWVDDYPSHNEGIISLFRSKNIEVDIAISTDHGVDLFEKNPYDAIITDMGRFNDAKAGIELINQLKIRNVKVPIIVFASSRAISNYGEEAIGLGAYKATCNVSELITTIMSILW